ncbi:MAG: acyl-CoA reductase, partial [Bryobacteraceae bacterium]
TWVFALLTGNKSIVRLPSKRSPQTDVLCESIGQLLRDKEDLRRSNYFVRYGHEREITASLSAACDVRTIWGGDAAVNEIRRIPLGPYAKELCFADRYSLSAIRSAAYLDASSTSKRQLLRDFFNDAFWFDQMACSSPRLVVWCGNEGENAEAATSFFAALEEETCRRGYALDPAARMNKFLFACEAVLDQPVASSMQQQHITVLELREIENLERRHCGGGLFLHYQTARLGLIAPYLKRQDQTLTYFGFERTELEHLARCLNGGGIDRIVPIGQALAFGRFWDGYDLLAEFTRSVVIQ